MSMSTQKINLIEDINKIVPSDILNHRVPPDLSTFQAQPNNIWKFSSGDWIPFFAYFCPIQIKENCLYIFIPKLSTNLTIISKILKQITTSNYYNPKRFCAYTIWGNFIYKDTEENPYKNIYPREHSHLNFLRLKKIYAGLFIKYSAFREKRFSEIVGTDLMFGMDTTLVNTTLGQRYFSFMLNNVKTNNIGLTYTEDIHKIFFPDSKLITSPVPKNSNNWSDREYNTFIDNISSVLSNPTIGIFSYIPLVVEDITEIIARL